MSIWSSNIKREERVSTIGFFVCSQVRRQAQEPHSRKTQLLQLTPPPCLSPPVWCACAALPQEPPEGLLSLLLPSGPAAAPGAAMDARLGMPQLQHLALIFPPRSVLPPTAPPPDALSTLTQVSRGQWPRCMPVGTRVAFLCWNMERTPAAGCRHRPAAPRACMHAGRWCAAACWKKSTALGITLHGFVSFCMFLNWQRSRLCTPTCRSHWPPPPHPPHTADCAQADALPSHQCSLSCQPDQPSSSALGPGSASR